MRTTLKIAGAALGLALAANAQAAFVYIDTDSNTGLPQPVPANNNFQSQLAGVGVVDYNLFVSLGVNAPGQIIVTYFGKEAGFTNRFLFPGGNITTSGTGFDAWGPIASASFNVASAGALDFSFCVVAGGAGCVTNLQNDLLTNAALQNIGMRITDNGTTAWLLWDDSGAGPDDNHDDMIIRLQWTVPEPATLGLLGLGLLGAGAVARRRRK